MKKFLLLLFVGLLILPAEGYGSAKVKRPEYFDVATIFKDNGEYDKAIEVLEAAKNKDDPRFKQYLGKLYYLAGDSKKAQELLESIKDKDWITYLYLGLASEDLGNDPGAIGYYRQSIKKKKNSIALYRSAKIYLKVGNYKKAEKYFIDTIDLDPSIKLAYYYLGDTLYRLHQYELAYYYLTKAVNFYPDFIQAKELFYDVKEKLGQEYFAKKKKKKKAKRKSVRLKAYTPEEDAPFVRVGLAEELNKFTVRCGQDFLIKDEANEFQAKKDTFYSFNLKDNEVILSDESSQELAMFSDAVSIETDDYPFYVLDITYGKGNFWHKKIDRKYRGDLRILIADEGMTLVNVINIEEYLYGVLPSEISTQAPPEAQKAQAVAARTIALRYINRHRKKGYDFCSDVHCQVYQGLSVETAKATEAVKATRGQALVYNDKPIEAFYYANSGGCIRKDAFGEPEFLSSKFDNLRGFQGKKDVDKVTSFEWEEWFLSTPDTFSTDEGSKFRWQRSYDAEDFKLVFGFDIDKLSEITMTEKNDCFHCEEIEVITSDKTQKVKGDLKIRNFFDKLRSSAFKLEIKHSNDKPSMLIFWGAGFGHGSGLSQEGAQEMAEEGYTYKKILKHYYPKVHIKKMY